MTHSSDRLSRMEALLATTIEGLARTEKIVESNAHAIEAWGDRIEEGIAEAEEVTSQATANLGQQVAGLENNTGIDRVRYDQLHEEHSQRFNNLLEEARADRQRIDQSLDRIDETLERAERDRVLNESEHRAFRETFQTLLAEIARLWQRVAG